MLGKKLAELKNEHTFQLKFSELELGKFWIFIKMIFKFIKISFFRVIIIFNIILISSSLFSVERNKKEKKRKIT